MTFTLAAQADGGGSSFSLRWLVEDRLQLSPDVTVIAVEAGEGDASLREFKGVEFITYDSQGFSGSTELSLSLSDGSSIIVPVQSLSESDSTIDISGRRINDEQFGPSRYSNGNRYTINTVPYYDGETVLRIPSEDLLDGILNENGTTEGLSVTLDSAYIALANNERRSFDITYVASEDAYYISGIDRNGYVGSPSTDALIVSITVSDETNGYDPLVFTSIIDRAGAAPDGYVQPELPVLVEPTPFEGYDPINNWQPQRRLEINPGGPAAEPLGDELVINDARGRLFGLNNRASDGTFDELTGVAFVMGAEGAFDDGTIAGKEYIGTLEFDLQEGYRTTANFNNAQLSPIMGSVSADGTLDGALVDTETGAVMALFENVNVL